MNEPRATATTSSKRTSEAQLLDDQALEAVKSLSDEDLEQFTGGGRALTYQTAKALQDAYIAADNVMRSVGQGDIANYFAGIAEGIGKTYNGA